MPTYSISGPDGKTYSIEGPEGATRDQVIEAIQSRMTAQVTPPAPSTERTGGDVVKDVVASAATGIGGLLSFPGQIVKLIPGLQQVGSAIETPGEYLTKFGEDLKSAGLKAREALRSEALSEAEKDGVLSQFATAITSTIKDPALLSSFFIEQLPLLLGPAGAAKVAQKVGAKGIEAAGVGLTGRAAEEAVTAATQRVGRQAAGAAIGTGAAMQAGDISSDTYNAAYQRAIQQGMSPEEANSEALNAARLAGAGAAGISALTGFGLGKLFPSTAAIERRMAGLPGAGRLPSVVGEASSESLEEAGGQIFRNIGVRQIDPSQSLTEGVGAAAGLGALGGGFFGGLMGKKPEAELAPGQLPGETLYQTAERLNKQISAIDEAFKTAEAPQKPRYLSSAEIVDMYRTQGYGAVKQYQNTLETERKDESLSKEERKAANEQARDVQDFLNQVTLEESIRQTESVTQNVLGDREIHLGMGIPRADPIYKTLLNKDLGKPEDAEAVVNALEGALQRKGLRLTQYERFATALENINQYLSTIPGSGFYAQPSVEPSGREGAGVAGVSGERPAAKGVDKVKQPRVVRPTEVVGEPPRGEAAEPAALTPAEPVETNITAPAPPSGPLPFEKLTDRQLQTLAALTAPEHAKDARDARAELERRKAAAVTKPVIEAAPTAALPKELAGAKPRYAYGPKQFQLEFASDIDKALFITAQKTPSKRDADYRAWLESQGFTPEQISTQGTAVRQNIKEMAAASDPKQGPLKIAPVSTAKPAEIKERKIKDKIGNTVTEVTLPDGSKHQIIRLDSIEGFGLRGWHDNKNKGPAGSGYLGDTKEEAIKELMRRRKRSLKAGTEERAEKVLEEAEKTEKELLTEQRAELIKQLDGILNRILAKYGLKGVKLDLKEAFDSEGSYQRQIITLALNVDSPVRVLRHESIHALKDMGFFTPEQWRVLQKRAKDEWVQNLKDIKHSDKQSRYDAYVEIFDKEAKDKGLAGDEAAKYVEEAVIEEAIADAFGIYEETKAPPGLMNAILNRMNKLFKAIKEAFNIAGIESAEDIFGKIEKGQLKPILKPTEAVVEGEEPAKPSLRQVRDIFNRAEDIPEPPGVESIRQQWIGGVSGVGDRDSMYDLYRINGSKKYIKDVQNFIRKELGDDFKGYRLMSNDELEELQTGSMGTQYASFTLNPDVARAFKNIPAYASKTGMSVVEMNLTPEHIEMIGHPGELELVVNYGQGYNPSDVKVVEKYSLRQTPAKPSLRSISTSSNNFKKWSDNAPVIVDADDYEGGPAVFKAFHGTTHNDITVFDTLRGSKEGSLGSGPYLSTSVDDVNANYAGVGPDLTVRISREEEQLSDAFNDDNYSAGEMLENYFSDNDLNVEITDNNFDELKDEYREKAIHHAAIKSIKGKSEGLVVPAYVRLLKPFDMRGNKGTRFYIEQEIDEEGEPIGEPTGSGIKLIETIRAVEELYNTDASDLIDYIYEQQEVTAQELFDRASKSITNLYDENGELISSGQFIQDVAREMGFDGLIQQAGDYFGAGRVGAFGIRQKGMQGVYDDTLHIMPFTSEQIKSSIGNIGTWGQEKPTEEQAKRLGMTTEEAVKAQKKGDIRLSLRAPEWVPQNIWDLHEKVILADDEATGRVTTEKGKAPGALKRNQTMAFRRLNEAVNDYVGGDEQAALDLMVRMNEETSRRAEEGEVPVERKSLRKWYEDGTPRQQDELDNLPVINDFNGMEFIPVTGLVDSANSTYEDFEIAPQVREVPLQPEFVDTNERLYGTKKEQEYISSLAQRISENQKIEPLIVALEPDGETWILEGQHRVRALSQLGFKSLPARVVVSMEGDRKDYELPLLKREEPKTDYKKAEGQLPLFSLRSPLGLYSELESKIESIDAKQAPAAQWKTMIKALSQKGVKPEEIEWSGVNDWLDLQAGKVKKDDLLNYLRANGVRVEEVVLGAREPWRERLDLLETRGYRNLSDDERQELEKLRDRFEQEGPSEQPESAQTKYNQYTLPGGDNYREVLLTLPPKKDARRWVSPNGAVFTAEELSDPVVRRTAERVGLTEVTPESGYRSSHWDQPNVIAHIRLNDRTDADGNKVLFVEEIQSDWGQEGKKKGFAYKLSDEEIEKKLQFKETFGGGFNVYTAEGKMVGSGETRSEALADAINGYRAAEQAGIPAAPFVSTEKFAVFKDNKEVTRTDKDGKEVKQRYDSMEAAEAAAKKVGGEARSLGIQASTEGWLNLALKRVMVMAAEGDYDKVAFINGEQSVDRYKLSKKVKELGWNDPNSPYLETRTYEKAVYIDLKNGDNLTLFIDEDGTVAYVSGAAQSGLAGKRLDEVIGKDLAERVMSEPSGVVSGEGLDIGGTGMKTFYNSIVPNTLKKLLPKVGGDKTKEVAIVGSVQTPSLSDYTNYAEFKEASKKAKESVIKQIGFDVTPAMKEKVETTGLPKFSLRSTSTPEFKQWFGNSKVVDSDGNPLVVYHGTTSDITTFRPSPKINRTGNPDGYYFTTSYDDAARYAGVEDKKEGANIIPVFLRIQKPFVQGSAIPKIMVDQFRKELEADNPHLAGSSWIDEKVNIFKERGKSKTRWFPEIFPNITFPTDAMTRVLQAGGYDGFKDGDQHWIAIQSNQIKSAIGNVGTYGGEISPELAQALGMSQEEARAAQEEGDIRLSLRSLVSNAMTPSVTKTINKIAPPTYNPNLWERILNTISGDSFTKLRAETINRYERLADIDRAVAKQIKQAGGVEQLADQKAESAALFSDLGAGLLETAMGANDKFGGVPVFRNGITVIDNFNRTVKGPILIFKPLADLKDPDVFRLWQVWKSVQRGKRLDVEGRENLIDKADMQAINQMERQNPNLIKIFKLVDKDWKTYNDKLVQYMVDTGVITPQMAKEWTQHGDYFPFYRLVDFNDVQGPKMFSSLANVRPPKKLKGGESPLGDIFENIVRNSQAAIQAGIKNVAAQRATQQALRIQQVTRLPAKSSGPNVYRVMENGQEVYYESADPLFIDAIKSLNMPDLPFIGLLSGPANILRNLVTKDPAFMLANMMRDSMAAWVTSGVKMTPIIDTARNFGLAIANKSPETQQLYAAGVLGGYDYARGVKTSAEDFRKRLRELSKTKTPTEKLLSPFTSLWAALEKGTQASDAATRAEVYKRVLAETGNQAEAYWQALEVMNFNRRGRSPVIRVLTAAIPFLNARMQGLDLLFRTAIYPVGGGSSDQAFQRMKTFWVRGMTMMALSGMYWFLTHDDDEYKKQEQEVRDDYWLIPSLGIKIPIPFEIGIMFKVIPERIAELTFGSDTNKDFTKAMKRQFLNTFGVGLPQVARPFIEVSTNHNFFTDRPIIGKGLEDVADPYQVGPSTSRVAEAIGKSVGYSPMKVDHLIKGFTGTMGTYAVDLFDMVFDMTDRPQKATKRFEQMPIIKRFALDPEARGTVTAYYEFKDRVDEIVRTSNLLKRSMNFEEYGKYMQDNLGVLAFKEQINSLERTMKQYREMKTVVMSSQMDGDQKRDTITSIGRMESALTQNIQILKKIAD